MTHPTRLWRIVLCFLLLLSIGIVGCGGGVDELPTANVEGTVLLGDRPVTEGKVTFFNPERGVPFAAPLDSSGHFKFEEPIEVGDYTVFITPPQSEKPPSGPEDMEAQAQAQPSIPAGYTEQTQSDLKAEVKEGQENKFDFKLNPAGPPASTAAGPTPP